MALLGSLGGFAIIRNNASDRDAASGTPLASHTPTDNSGAVTAALAYRGEHGTLYDVDWRVSTSIPVPGLTPQSTALDVVGVVQVTDLGAEGARRLVGVRLVSLRSANMTALEQPLYADTQAAQAALVGQPVVLALSADGAVEDIYLEPNTSPLAKNVLTALALHFGVTLPRPVEAKTQLAAASNGYVATEPGDFGQVVWNYTRASDRLSKSTDGEQGKGRGEVRFEGTLPVELRCELLLGAPAAGAIENDPGGGEPLVYGSGSFRATRQSKTSNSGALWPRPDLATLERHAPDERPTPIDQTASNLAVANGFTVEDLQFMVAALGNGQAPRKGDLIRAAGFMRAHPESCDTLAAQFAASPPKAREFILDLLSSSGDTKAQAVMRTVLATPAAHRDPALYQYMLQRFAFVDHPNAESVAFVFAEWESAKRAGDTAWRQASAYTLGSLAFHAQNSDSTKLADEILQSLLRDLTATRDEDEEVGLIASIGNTGMPAARQPILARADSKQVRLRSQAAISLRKFDDEKVRSTLITLVGDEDLQVAQSALRSLDTQTIGEAELLLLAERTESGRMNVSVDPALVTFVAAHSRPIGPAARILRAIGARVGDRYRLKDQVDNALASLLESGPGKAAAPKP